MTKDISQSIWVNSGCLSALSSSSRKHLAIYGILVHYLKIEYLEISVKSGNHKNLLESLGRLRQGIKSSRVHSGRDNEISGTFRGRLDENRSFYLNEISVTEVPANELGDPTLVNTSWSYSVLVSQQDVFTNRISTDVQISVLHS